MSSSSNPATGKPKSAFREWIDSIVFAVVAATLIRWLFFEAFVIPTPSMENSLLVGDYLFVSKMHYGTRTPITPIQVPLTHQYIWGTRIPSYLDWIKLPQFRLPGFSDVKRGDAVVFNLPVEHPSQVNKYSSSLPDLHGHPIDLRVNYIKRCVAIGGDKLEIKNGQVYINDEAQINPVRMESEYFVATTTTVNEEKIFKENGVTEPARRHVETFNDTIPGNDLSGYIVYTTEAIAEKLKTYDFVKSVQMVNMPAGTRDYGIYPSAETAWNKDNYGPIVLPKKGATVPITKENIAIYGEAIQFYDGNKNVEVVGDSLVKIDGKEIATYTFNQDYYFMMGDNRHNSADSRYWGFVPKDHIVGKAVFVWMSIDPDPSSFFNKIRWSRVFRVVK
jgi:signal peptidase I